MSEKTKAVRSMRDTSLPGLVAFKSVVSNEELSHAGKHTKRNFPVKVEDHSYYCVVCGRDAKPGMGDFCSMACQKEQYGV